jgi:hypothetical protein
MPKGFLFSGSPQFDLLTQGAVVDEKSRTVMWEFKNLVPTQDIYFGLGGVPDFESLDRKQPSIIQSFPPLLQVNEPSNKSLLCERDARSRKSAKGHHLGHTSA